MFHSVLIGDSMTVAGKRYTVAGRCFINGLDHRCPVIGNEHVWLIRQVNKGWEGTWHCVIGERVAHALNKLFPNPQ